jgi:hypothetical protein
MNKNVKASANWPFLRVYWPLFALISIGKLLKGDWRTLGYLEGVVWVG